MQQHYYNKQQQNNEQNDKIYTDHFFIFLSKKIIEHGTNTRRCVYESDNVAARIWVPYL